MSFDQLSSTESQPTTTRRHEDPEYRDDPEFSRFAEELSVKLFTLTSNISRLSQQISLLGTKRDTERVRERVHDLLEESRNGFKEAGEGIKRLNAWPDLNASQRYTQQRLSREFQSSGSEFQTIQRLTLEKQKSSASTSRQALETGDASGLPRYTDDPQQQQQTQQQDQLQLAPQDEVDFQESLIIERESEIRNIEHSVGELNELFRDVAHMVQEQGGELDRIDANVQNTVTDTRNADLELRSANRYQKQARGKACCLLVILAVVLTIIIVAAVSG
ncbi:MAG: hypothetical protein GOMPHAMPRED_007174 [Gomphillus americanus]|uniref:t-SNARE coiled-coil homology domain-containing protein n=1 Tax=Gomphillus americanus TaxID=1940652 RepID=A0A8H3EUV7_9LECA|nr:MAG: hypothetical protein GOMPHAMPRED_007174 [Gomphillus americanus]